MAVVAAVAGLKVAVGDEVTGQEVDEGDAAIVMVMAASNYSLVSRVECKEKSEGRQGRENLRNPIDWCGTEKRKGRKCLLWLGIKR